MIVKTPFKKNMVRIFSNRKRFIRKKDEPETLYMEIYAKKNQENDYIETDVEIDETEKNIDIYYD